MNKKELEEKIALLEGELKKIKENLSEIKEVKKEFWMPKTHEEYFSVLAGGAIKTAINFDSEFTEERIDFLNVFKTEELAKKESDKILLRRKLEKFALENNTEEIDWTSCYSDQDIYCISFDYITEAPEVDTAICYHRDFGQVYFTSAEIAEKAIEEFGDELKEYFRG